MKKLLFLPLLLVVGCASKPKFNVEAPLYGEVNFNESAVKKTAVSPQKVKVIYGKLLRGFELNDEDQLDVMRGYKHKVVGPIHVKSNEEVELTTASDKKSFTLNMLKQMRTKAFAMGANAVINANATTFGKYPSATGYAVIIKNNSKKTRRVANTNKR